MTIRSTPAADTVAELRRAFDLSFAEAPLSGLAAREDLLEIGLDTARYALRVSDIAGLFADVNITPVPTTVRELLGIGGVRGAILPVYDLRALLGHPPKTPPRWLAVASVAPVGLAFDTFEGQLRVPAEAIIQQRHGRGHDAASLPHIREVINLGALARPVVSITSVLETIAACARAGGSERT